MKIIFRLPLLFLGACLPSLAGAQAGVTLLVKTDVNCNWKLDGQSMGLLTDDTPKVILVSPGEHVVEASATVGTAIIRTKVKVEQVEKTVDLHLKGQNQKNQDEQEPKVQQPKSPRQPAEANSGENSTWTDATTGLMWTAKDNGLDVDWPQATAYCSELKLAGYDNWRLPTLEQMQGIYDPTLSVQTVFGDGVKSDVHVRGNLKLTGWTWSSLQGDSPGEPYQVAWLFKLGDQPLSSNVGKPLSNFLHYTYNMRALCVRRVDHS